MWLLKKALPSREEPDISLSVVNSKACLHLLYIRVRITHIILAQSMVTCSVGVAMILYVGILNVWPLWESLWGVMVVARHQIQIVNSKAPFYLLYTLRTHTRIMHVKSAWSTVNTHDNSIRWYIEHVTSHKRKNRFGSHCEGWQLCTWWRENCWCSKVSFMG